MPVTYYIDKNKEVVFAAATGELTAEDIRTYRREAIADPDFAPHFDNLFDFRGITGVKMSGNDIKWLARASIFEKRARKAHVAPTKNMFGVSRMFSLFLDANPNEMQVFYDMDEARRWLDLD